MPADIYHITYTTRLKCAGAKRKERTLLAFGKNKIQWITDLPAGLRGRVNDGGGMTMTKEILDVTCGDRTIWFQKNEPHTIYCDKRKEEFEGDFGKTLRADGKKKHRHLVINPDVVCDFTDLPFDDCSFSLVVFDPPHIENLSQSSWMRKSYGSLDGDWKPMIRNGFKECMRVLKSNGVLVFKWSDISVSTRDILNVVGQEPLFGHRSGKKMNTHWMCFMKFDDRAR